MTSPDATARASSSARPIPVSDQRLQQLTAELDDHARIARYLGVDFQRAVAALDDGYPDTAVTQVGKITEKLLKQLWIHHGAPGTPAGKTLRDLIQGCRPYIRSQRVLDALHEIQRLRNRASHDGYPIAAEDGLVAIRRLLDVLDWYTSTGSGALTAHAPRLAPAAAAQAEWLAGLYLTLDYRLARRRELSTHAVYLLFTRERGLRTEHTELLVCRDAAEADEVLAAVTDLLQAGLPQLTRILVLEQATTRRPARLPADCQIVTCSRFMDVFADLDRHLADVAAMYPVLGTTLIPVEGDLLSIDERTGDMTVAAEGNALDLLGRLAADGGNLLVIGPPGSGKTTLLKQLTAAPPDTGARRYRFFFDLSLKGRQESFADFVTRTLSPYMHMESAYVFPAFCYFTRAGSVLVALDSFDEAVPDVTPAGLLSLFTDVAQILSAESAVVMTSRVSFLQDSPQTRRLLDGTRLMSEKLAQQLHARGVDPRSLPRFSVLRLHAQAGESLLATELRQQTPQPQGRTESARPANPPDLAGLLWRHVTDVAGPGLLPEVVDYLGLAFLRGITVFPLIELVNALGINAFDDSHVEMATFRLSDLFRKAVPDGTALALRHVAYQELLAAEFLRDPARRKTVLATAPHPRLTEEVREFLYRRTLAETAAGRKAGPGTSDPATTCIVPAGIYLVGPSHQLMLRRLDKPVCMDEFAVTVAQYKRFLNLVSRHGSAEWDHPDTPADHSHQPREDRLPVPSYYQDSAYDNHPAVAVNWWSAYAFARSEGKRLPTSLEWEAAARGFDGRLFPWGDQVDLSLVNCADSWSEHPLITYAAWRDEHDRGHLAKALPGPVDAHPANTSPFGVRELVGNTWEWTSTVFSDKNESVICGGSFDNPYRAVQASSKGTCHRNSASYLVGFRCIEDLA